MHSVAGAMFLLLLCVRTVFVLRNIYVLRIHTENLGSPFSCGAMTQWEKCTYSMKCAQTYSCWQTTSLPSVKLPYIHFFVRWLYFRCICRWCTMHSCFRTRAQSAADGCCDGGFVSGLSNRRGTLHYVPACTLSFGAAHNIQCCTVALDAPRRHGHTYSMCNVHRNRIVWQ